MKNFNYKEYLTEGWMQQEVGSPESITSEESLYRWVEANCNNLDDILRLNPKELQEPVSVAKEEGLSPREFVEDWVTEYGDWVDIAEILGLKVVKGPKVGSPNLHEDTNSGATVESIIMGIPMLSDDYKRSLLDYFKDFTEEGWDNMMEDGDFLDDLTKKVEKDWITWARKNLFDWSDQDLADDPDMSY